MNKDPFKEYIRESEPDKRDILMFNSIFGQQQNSR